MRKSMSPAETRKNQILKFKKLDPLDRLLWCLDAGTEMFSNLSPEKQKIYLKIKNAEKIKRKNRLAKLLKVPLGN
ncbi:MAG: hypothetical protein A2X45_13285 [Lentisphaerae bacterium GWF2_50_93]|nr:MAG: hypothetical protein A2X45_13285 [Lentisphaerae bacterium GWF2_50_93]